MVYSNSTHLKYLLYLNKCVFINCSPNLTWRDVQHLVAWTSEYSPLKDNQGWTQNGAGYWINSAFGFGLMNAARLINAADPAHWQHVPEKFICYVQSDISSNLPQYVLINFYLLYYIYFLYLAFYALK